MALKKYNIIIQETAEEDLDRILEYISETLLEKATAYRIYKSIVESIQGLETMPKRCPIIDEEPYRKMKTRRLIIENNSAFYYVDDETNTVHILRILYNRREWKNLI